MGVLVTLLEGFVTLVHCSATGCGEGRAISLGGVGRTSRGGGLGLGRDGKSGMMAGVDLGVACREGRGRGAIGRVGVKAGVALGEWENRCMVG